MRRVWLGLLRNSAVMALVLWVVPAAIASPFGSGFEAVEKPLPRGLSHSAGPTRVGAPAALSSAASESPLVHGTLVRIAWSTLQAAPGVFDFTLLDREFGLAETLQTQISLGVLDAWNQPAWLLDECESFEFTFQSNLVQACLPWDAHYLARKQELLNALGERYAHHPNLGLVYMTYAAMTNGIEMHWRVDEAAFTAAGYTAERLQSTYRSVFDMHVAAFPGIPIAMEVHEVFDSGALAVAAYQHCHDRLGSRCGVALWWCASRLTRPPNGESEVWAVAADAFARSFVTCQTVGNFTNQPDRFDEGAGWTPLQALQNEMNFMYNAGVTHWELWSVDITNPEFQPELTDYANRLE